MPLLEIESVSKRFGGLAALEEVSFAVDEGEICGLIGPNGAGKTTLFNVVSGFYSASAGSVRFDGRSIGGLPAHEVASLGLVRTFQLTNLFLDMDVFSNVLVGASAFVGLDLVRASLATRGDRRRTRTAHARADEVLSLLGLTSDRGTLARVLPYGHQRLLAVGMALSTGPKMMLLDEPMAGMNAGETLEMAEHLRRIRDMGITLLVVEHNMQGLMALAEKIVVLNFGTKLAEGTPTEIGLNREVIAAYLGGEEAPSGES